MWKRIVSVACVSVLLVSILSGCSRESAARSENQDMERADLTETEMQTFYSGDVTVPETDLTDRDALDVIIPDTVINSLEPGLSVVMFEGNDGFETLLSQGGAASDHEVAVWLSGFLAMEAGSLDFMGEPYGCSTLSVGSPTGERLFGRNFDWNFCEAMIVISKPESGYSSISTVNMDFIQAGMDVSALSDHMKTIAALYAPLDGMNEKGLAVSVNMIQDNTAVHQNTEHPDITTTTAVRLLLNQAADVDEAVALLGQYDMNSSMDYMVHFALADATGNSVVVEYVDNEMMIIPTPVVTNFYLAEGEKYGIGTSQSHERYDALTDLLEENESMDMEDVRDALGSVGKKNYGGFESTEWSIVFNLTSKDVWYYHRENFETGYQFHLEVNQ